MKTQATVQLRLTGHFFHASKSAWRTYWTEERKIAVTFVLASFSLSGVFFWFALSSLY